MKWTCKECGAELNLKESIVPKSCYLCGGSMESYAYAQKAEIRQKNEADLVTVVNKLNTLYEEAEPLHIEYKQIMNYFKSLYLKKQITADEYQEKASLFKYRKTGGRPIGSKVTEDGVVITGNEDIMTDINMDVAA